MLDSDMSHFIPQKSPVHEERVMQIAHGSEKSDRTKSQMISYAIGEEVSRFMKEYDPSSLKALPPKYQEEREVKALQKLFQEKAMKVLSITKDAIQEKKVYCVKTNQGEYKATVVYDPIDRCGPAKFHFEIDPPL